MHKKMLIIFLDLPIFGKRVTPKSWVMRNLRVDASVAGQIDSVASMYAQMGLSKEDIKTNLDNYINQNYAESVHVIDPNFSIHNDKAKTRMALSLVFLMKMKDKNLTRVNDALPRGFRLGEPQRNILHNNTNKSFSQW